MTSLHDWQISLDDSELATTGLFTVIVSRIGETSDEFRMQISRVNGITYPKSCGQDRWNYLNDVVKYKDSDILVVTYPKCGTTWTEQTVLLLLSASSRIMLDPESKNTYRPGHSRLGKIWPEACIDQQHLSVIPGPEFKSISIQDFDDAPSPRVIKSHAPLHNLLNSHGRGVEMLPVGSKVIVVARNPLDACVSSYYHAFNPYKCGWPFAAWAKVWIDGYFPHGSWYTWVRDWYLHSRQFPERVLWLQYEEMLESPVDHVKRIAAFMGCDPEDNDLINTVVRGASFDAMKNDAGGADHLRKGICGDWRNHFSNEMADIFKEKYREYFSGTGLQFKLGNGEILT